MREVDVLHILGPAHAEGAGIARIVAGLAAEIDQSRFRIHAWFTGCAGPLANELQEAGIPTRWIHWERGAHDPIGAARLWLNLRQHAFGIVHLHVGARAMRLVVRTASNAKIIVHLHGLLSGDSPRRVLRLATRGADVVLAASYAIARQASEAHAVPIHAGIAPTWKRSEHKFGESDRLVIGTACRLVRDKGLHHLLEAFARLRGQFPQARLEIAGSGPLRTELEDVASTLGLTETVLFLGWQHDIRGVMAGWDVFVLPSLDEGFGLAALEAMSVGVPVIATSVGGLPELVTHGEVGYLVTPGSVSELEGALRSVLLDSTLRVAFGRAARLRTMQLFSLKQMASKIDAVYESLLSR